MRARAHTHTHTHTHAHRLPDAVPNHVITVPTTLVVNGVTLAQVTGADNAQKVYKATYAYPFVHPDTHDVPMLTQIADGVAGALSGVTSSNVRGGEDVCLHTRVHTHKCLGRV